MHPFLKRKSTFASYMAAWLLIGALLAALIRISTDLSWLEAFSESIPMSLAYGCFCLTSWNICRTLPLASTSIFKLTLNTVGAAIVSCAVWVAVAEYLARTLGLGSRFTPAVPQFVVVGLLLYLLSLALTYAYLAIEASREAAILARDAELRALKSQINPHFLFNCLNSISALTTSDPVRAREMCLRLSDFLRKTLGLGERESLPWREELELARTYLEVERVRFGSRLQVEMDIDQACEDCQVPALVLQPLVENAIKHGIATLVDGGTVRLRVHRENGNIAVRVENNFDPEAPAPRRHGLGLRNLRSRLETRFGAAAHFTAGAHENTFLAEMTFPCVLQAKIGPSK